VLRIELNERIDIAARIETHQEFKCILVGLEFALGEEGTSGRKVAGRAKFFGLNEVVRKHVSEPPSRAAQYAITIRL
jgi:hypothetical protein